MSAQNNLNLNRIADQINVVLTQIFRDYVAQGSPTKLGGLRFLDIESSKTFAFEKTEVSEDGKGNILLFSAPYASIDQDKEPTEVTDKKVVEADVIDRVKKEVLQILKAGVYGDSLHSLSVRPSKDAGKSDRFFIEVGYFVPTMEWLSDENVIAYATAHNLDNMRSALVRILEEKILPMARAIMEFLIHNLRSMKAEA
ncbi:MAG: hypothetical protein ACI376_07135 [Candidatus Bruticola sp.]